MLTARCPRGALPSRLSGIEIDTDGPLTFVRAFRQIFPAATLRQCPQFILKLIGPMRVIRTDESE